MEILGICSSQTAWYNEKVRQLQIASGKMKWQHPKGRAELIRRQLIVMNDAAMKIGSFVNSICIHLPGSAAETILKNHHKSLEKMAEISDLLKKQLPPGEELFVEGGYTGPDNLPK